MEDTILGLVTEIKNLVEPTIADAEKADKGNRQAGIRVRKNMLEIANLCKVTRAKVIETRNG